MKKQLTAIIVTAFMIAALTGCSNDAEAPNQSMITDSGTSHDGSSSGSGSSEPEKDSSHLDDNGLPAYATTDGGKDCLSGYSMTLR